ncbi:MAG: hypothetical protein GY760_29215 [Deltaproteobacteria bacterium]|nr:hypothetical protein [Deltaproteobacteria bacterium]
MNERFCKKYPELCQKDYFTDNFLGIRDYGKKKVVPEIVPEVVPVEPRFKPIERRYKKPFIPPERRYKEPTESITESRFKPPVAPYKPTIEEQEAPKSFRAISKIADMKVKSLKKKALESIGLGNETVKEDMRQHKYSRLADVAYSYGYKDYAGAEEIIKNGDYIPDFKEFTIIPNLSTKDRVVLKNTKTGEVVMSLRGSDASVFGDVNTLKKDPSRIFNLEDWWVNAHTAMGNPEKTERYKETTRAVRETAKVLGIEPSEIHFTGHSNGGGNARRQAEIFGSKATIFNGADNPILDMSNPERLGGVAEGTEIKAYRTFGDLVSAGHETKSKNKEHFEVERLTAKPGTEIDLIEQHGIDQFYHDNPKVLESGQIENVRTGKVKNFMGTVGGTLASGALGVGSAELLAPVYEDPAIEAKEQVEMLTEMATVDLNPGGTMVGALNTMGLLLPPDEVKIIREKLGLKSKPPPKSKPPAVVRYLKGLTGRAKEDKEIQDRIDEYYGGYNLTQEQQIKDAKKSKEFEEKFTGVKYKDNFSKPYQNVRYGKPPPLPRERVQRYDPPDVGAGMLLGEAN